jgi:hypothetical protein
VFLLAGNAYAAPHKQPASDTLVKGDRVSKEISRLEANSR